MGKSESNTTAAAARKKKKKKVKNQNERESSSSSSSSSSSYSSSDDDDDEIDDDDDNITSGHDNNAKAGLRKRREKDDDKKNKKEKSAKKKGGSKREKKKKRAEEEEKKKKKKKKKKRSESPSSFLKSEWFQSWLGRVLIYMFVLVVARTLKGAREGNGNDGKSSSLSGRRGGRRYDTYGKSTCDAIQCDFARAQLKRITREAFRGTAVSAFEQIESNRDGRLVSGANSRVLLDESGGFEGGGDGADGGASSNKPLVLALVSDDQSDFDSILKPGSSHNPFKMAEKKGCFKRLIVNDPYESSLKTSSRSKGNANSLSDPREIAERRGEIQKELSQFFLECGKKTGGGVVYVRMAKHINVKLLPALLPAFSENGGYTVDGELVPSKDFVFILEVLKPIVEKSSAFSRERSEYAKALKSGNEATFTRIVKSKLAFYWGVDEEDESLSANALAMRRRVDYVVPVSVLNKDI